MKELKTPRSRRLFVMDFFSHRLGPVSFRFFETSLPLSESLVSHPNKSEPYSSNLSGPHQIHTRLAANRDASCGWCTVPPTLLHNPANIAKYRYHISVLCHPNTHPSFTQPLIVHMHRKAVPFPFIRLTSPPRLPPPTVAGRQHRKPMERATRRRRCCCTCAAACPPPPPPLTVI
jgi:hypothetical protein